MAVSYRRLRTLTTGAGIVLAALMLGGFWLTAQLNSQSSIIVPAQTASLDEASLRIIQAHLWLEEVLSEERRDSVEQIWTLLHEADLDIERVMFGGTTTLGRIEAVDDPAIQDGLIVVHDLLHDFVEIAKNRHMSQQSALTGSDLDPLFDAVYQDLMSEIRLQTEQLRLLGDRRHTEAQNLIWLTAMILISLTIAFCVLVHVLDTARQSAVERLHNANDTITAQNAQLSYMAHYDALTSTPNRVAFGQRLDQELARARSDLKHLAVMFIDLDNFKTINDSLGHDVGDGLLVEVAKRLSAELRAVDLLARLGGDEFTLILPDFDSERTAADAAGHTATQILLRLAEPVILPEQKPIHVGASIGIVVGPDEGDEAGDLMRKADMAMYEVKFQGKNGYRFYSPELTRQVEERLRLENGLRRAMDRGELFTVYQPILDLESGDIVSCEALLRWHDPELGPVPPDIFIELAEQNGQIGELGLYVVDQVLQAMTRPNRSTAFAPLSFSINVSAQQLKSDNFVHALTYRLRKYDIDPSRLQIEITERVLLDTNETVLKRLSGLRALGIKVALDDFGTGYSSLSVLDTITLDALKIDKSFVDRIGRSRQAEALVDSMISIGRNFNTRIVAEGIENPVQRDFLRRHGCDQAQGYLFSRPLSEADLADLMQNGPREEKRAG